MVKLSKIVQCAIFILLFFIPSIIFAQTETTTIKTTQNTVTDVTNSAPILLEYMVNDAINNTPISREYLLEYQRDVFNQITEWNLTYLSIILGVVALLIGAVYLFNWKPFKEQVDKSEEKRKEDFKELSEKLTNDIKLVESKSLAETEELQNATIELKNKLEIQIDKTKKLMERIQDETKAKQKELEKKVDERINTLDSDFKRLELDTIWNEYEAACLNKHRMLALMCLGQFIRQSIDNNRKYYISIAVDGLERTLSDMIEDKFEINFFKKYKFNEEINTILSNLEKKSNLKSEIKNFEDKKNGIIALINKILETKEKEQENI